MTLWPPTTSFVWRAIAFSITAYVSMVEPDEGALAFEPSADAGLANLSLRCHRASLSRGRAAVNYPAGC